MAVAESCVAWRGMNFNMAICIWGAGDQLSNRYADVKQASAFSLTLSKFYLPIMCSKPGFYSFFYSLLKNSSAGLAVQENSVFIWRF